MCAFDKEKIDEQTDYCRTKRILKIICFISTRKLSLHKIRFLAKNYIKKMTTKVG